MQNEQIHKRGRYSAEFKEKVALEALSGASLLRGVLVVVFHTPIMSYNRAIPKHHFFTICGMAMGSFK